MAFRIIVIVLLVSVAGFCQKGFFSKDWNAIIDSTWGPGLPTAEKLAIFDSVWNVIDREYACFQNLEINWNEVRVRYRPEIENGVSSGRFAAILNHMGLKLKESHTNFFDIGVNFPSDTSKLPLISAGVFWGQDSNFSAGLIPLPDSSLLVYSAPPGHPLGLEAGDVVLGYEGVPWKILYQELLSREFPIKYNSLWGSNDVSFTHSWLSGAGQNWHLFDTIDIKKYSGEVIHLSTSLLKNNTTSIILSEQLPVGGVIINTKWNLSWGIVDGTNVGYIYVYNWRNNEGTAFYNALDTLINIYNIEGIILDFRVNSGGYFNLTNSGLHMLFNGVSPLLGLSRRDNPDDHYSMSNYSFYPFSGSTTTFFEKPIAVLSGCQSLSASDFMIERLRSHPHVKIFGKTSSSAFSSQRRLNLYSYVINYAFLNGWSEENPGEYLTHTERPIDNKVSFTPEDVRNGDDTVVKTALKWIKNTSGILEDLSDVSEYKLFQNYPNPFNSQTVISWYLPVSGVISIKIYSILGDETATVINEFQEAGKGEVIYNTTSLASGVYFYTIRSGSFTNSRKFILLK